MTDTRFWKLFSGVIAIGFVLSTILFFSIHFSVYHHQSPRVSSEKRDDVDIMLMVNVSINVSVNVLVREAAELAQWIKNNEKYAHIEDNAEDKEKIEEMEDNYENFVDNLSANLVRLAEMNELATQFMSLSQTEAVLNIQAQIKNLSNNLTSFQKLISAREVERFYQEVAKPWIGSSKKTNLLKATFFLLKSFNQRTY